MRIDQHAGEYAWKPMIVKEVVDEFGAALWIDSGNLATARLDMEHVRTHKIGETGFYSPKSLNTPWHWVHAGMFERFGMRKCCADPNLIKRKPCCCCGDNPPKFCTKCPGSSDLKEAYAETWLKKVNPYLFSAYCVKQLPRSSS